MWSYITEGICHVPLALARPGSHSHSSRLALGASVFAPPTPYPLDSYQFCSPVNRDAGGIRNWRHVVQVPQRVRPGRQWRGTSLPFFLPFPGDTAWTRFAPQLWNIAGRPSLPFSNDPTQTCGIWCPIHVIANSPSFWINCSCQSELRGLISRLTTLFLKQWCVYYFHSVKKVAFENLLKILILVQNPKLQTPFVDGGQFKDCPPSTDPHIFSNLKHLEKEII